MVLHDSHTIVMNTFLFFLAENWQQALELAGAEDGLSSFAKHRRINVIILLGSKSINDDDPREIMIYPNPSNMPLNGKYAEAIKEHLTNKFKDELSYKHEETDIGPWCQFASLCMVQTKGNVYDGSRDYYWNTLSSFVNYSLEN